MPSRLSLCQEEPSSDIQITAWRKGAIKIVVRCGGYHLNCLLGKRVTLPDAIQIITRSGGSHTQSEIPSKLSYGEKNIILIVLFGKEDGISKMPSRSGGSHSQM
ncbi:hypothetical protein CEXT_332451 [Caerostris extrusa]|uniref:Uncharacterized protein n=1 Tax=Caerostris extrusa TaxID=172846 RepID=A0AAV4QVA8_CAEEX|nr:hypothetical protein CEXT_332451 [Caerostris extrusa]